MMNRLWRAVWPPFSPIRPGPISIFSQVTGRDLVSGTAIAAAGIYALHLAGII
jgi:hypothetical protein